MITRISSPPERWSAHQLLTQTQLVRGRLHRVVRNHRAGTMPDPAELERITHALSTICDGIATLTITPSQAHELPGVRAAQRTVDDSRRLVQELLTDLLATGSDAG